jgi:hypothetical protein
MMAPKSGLSVYVQNRTRNHDQIKIENTEDDRRSQAKRYKVPVPTTVTGDLKQRGIQSALQLPELANVNQGIENNTMIAPSSPNKALSDVDNVNNGFNTEYASTEAGETQQAHVQVEDSQVRINESQLKQRMIHGEMKEHSENEVDIDHVRSDHDGFTQADAETYFLAQRQLHAGDIDDSYPTTTSGNFDVKSSDMSDDEAEELNRFEKFPKSMYREPATLQPNEPSLDIRRFNIEPQNRQKLPVHHRSVDIKEPQHPFLSSRHVNSQPSGHLQDGGRGIPEDQANRLPLMRNTGQQSHATGSYPDTTERWANANIPFSSKKASTKQNLENEDGFASQRPNGANRGTVRSLVNEQPISGTTDDRVSTAVEHPLLDYDKETLVGMDFMSLKNESFDKDPRADDFEMDEVDMEAKLAHAMENLDQEGQKKFFSSLPLDEWQEAGDWFLERFGDFIKHIVESRKQKRELAKRFEKEISTRHDDVSRKRKTLEDALTNMRTGGETLLTPNKKRAKR